MLYEVITGRRDADVCHDEKRLELIQHIVVDLPARGEIREIVSQPAVAPIDPSPETLDEALALFGLFLFAEHQIRILDLSETKIV